MAQITNLESKINSLLQNIFCLCVNRKNNYGNLLPIARNNAETSRIVGI